MQARSCWILAAIGLALASNAPAQAPAFPEPGARVRVRWDGGRRPLVGRLKELRGDTLVATDSASGEVIAVPLEWVRDFGVSRRAGRGLRIMGAIVGIAAGGVAGAWLGRKLPMRDVDPDCAWDDLDCEDLGPTSLAGKTAFGALFGGVLLGAVGYYLASAERWRPVPLPPLGVRARALPWGRFGMGASLDF